MPAFKKLKKEAQKDQQAVMSKLFGFSPAEGDIIHH